MGKGKDFELTVKNDTNEATHEWVKAHRPDFSGNSVGEVADVMVVWQAERYGDSVSSEASKRGTSGETPDSDKPHVAYVELKKRSGVDEGNRKVVMSGSSKGESGMDELDGLIEESPSWSDTYVGIKFPHRELIVIDAEVLRHWLRREQEGWGQEFLADERTVFEGVGSGADSQDAPLRVEDEYQKCEQHGARLTRGNNISMRKPELEWWASSSAGKPDWMKLAHEIGIENYDIKDDYRE